MRRFLLFFALGALLASCSIEDDSLVQHQLFIVDNNIPDSTSNVSSKDAESYVLARIRGKATKSGSDYFEITPIVSSENDTLMYIVNYDMGWEMLSGDKRTPPVVAHSEYGQLSLTSDNPGQLLWVEMMADDMLAIRNSSNEELVFSDQEILANLLLWEDDPLIPSDSTTKDIFQGHYELYSSTTYYNVYDFVDHLMPTQWSQDPPYNIYCPDKAGMEGKCPAGCDAVAAAQVLYYLHQKYGVPTMMYESASCVGDENSYLQSFWDMSADAWSHMRTEYGEDPYDVDAVLIAYAGSVLHSNYSYDETHVSIFNRHRYDDLFSSFGYSCSRGSYNANTLKSNLTRGLPVIVSAFPSGTLLDDYFSGHTFVIDGYSRERQVTTNRYRWINDITHQYDPIGHPDYERTSVSAPFISSVKMNWGWGSQWIDAWGYSYDNSGWYSMMSTWTTTHGEYSNTSAYMIYDFTLL